LVVATLNIRQ